MDSTFPIFLLVGGPRHLHLSPLTWSVDHFGLLVAVVELELELELELRLRFGMDQLLEL
jgi:hypothetical protein